MTVVVGFVGDNCAVMASDSQLTTGGVKWVADKIWIAPTDVLLGCASNQWAVKQHLENGIAAHLTSLNVPTLDKAAAKRELELASQTVLTQIYGTHAPAMAVPDHLLTILLVLGYADGEYWMLHVGPHGLAEDHDARGFYAIGSGFDAAQVSALLLDNYNMRLRPVHHLKMLAWRMVAGCIDVLSQAVGGPIQLWSSENGGSWAKASDDELSELAEAVNVWRETERESLALSLGEAPDTGDVLPESLGEVLEQLGKGLESPTSFANVGDDEQGAAPV